MRVAAIPSLWGIKVWSLLHGRTAGGFTPPIMAARSPNSADIALAQRYKDEGFVYANTPLPSCPPSLSPVDSSYSLELFHFMTQMC